MTDNTDETGKEYPVKRRDLIKAGASAAVLAGITSQSVTGRSEWGSGSADPTVLLEDDFEEESVPGNMSITAQNGLAYNDGFGYAVSDDEIKKFDIDSYNVVDSFDAPDGRPRGLAYGDNSLWFADGIYPDYDGEFLELDPQTGAVRSQFSTYWDPRGLAFGENSLWVVNITSNIVHEFDTDGTTVSKFSVPTTTPRGLAYFDGSLWLGTIDGYLYEFDTNGSVLQEIGDRQRTYGGLATTDTELLGPDTDGTVTVLQTVADPTVLLEDDFEEESVGDHPDGWNINGNSNQEVSDKVAYSGSQSFATKGSPGGCWQAIANHPLSLPQEGKVVFQGAYYPTDQGAVGCHNNSRGVIKLRTSNSSWSSGNDQSILNMTLNKFRGTGMELMSYNTNEWYVFEISYIRGNGTVEMKYTINGDPVGSTSRNVRNFEDDLQYLAVKSGDFLVYWDDFYVESAPGNLPGTVTGTVTNTDGDSLTGITVEFVPNGSDTPEETTTTASDGTYDVDLPTGAYKLLVEESGFEPVTIPVMVESGETDTVDITLTATDSAITISQVEVGPDALLVGVDTDLVFAIGVDPDPGASIDEVTVIRSTEFVAESIQQIGDGTLKTHLDSLGHELPDNSTEDPVQVFADLMGRPPAQIYVTTVPTDQIGLVTGDNQFTITAQTTDGSLTTDAVSVPRYERGDRLSVFGTAADGPLVHFDKNYFLFNHDVSFDNPLIPENLPVDPDVTLLDVDFTFSAAGDLNLNTLEPTAQDRLALGVNVFGDGIESQWGGEWGRNIDEFTYQLQRRSLWIAALLNKGIPVLTDMKLDLPDNPWIDKIGVDVEGIFGGYMLFGKTDPTDPGGSADAGEGNLAETDLPIPPTRELNTYTTLTAMAGASNIVEVFIDGNIDVASDIELGGVFQPPVGAPLAHKGGQVCLNGGLTIGPGPMAIDLTVDDFINEPCVSLGETRAPPCWEVFGYDEDCQKYPSAGTGLGPSLTRDGYDIETTGPYLVAPAGTNPPADALSSETDTATVTRLTDRSERDAAPALVARGNNHLAAWERHPQGEPADYGRDIVTAVRDSNGWSNPTTLAGGSGVSYHNPAIAVADGEAGITWTRYDIDDTESLEDTGPMTYIELVLEDGNGWDDPIVIEGTNAWFDSNPSIEPLGDGWVVAWERTDTADNSQQAVAYAVVDGSETIKRTETIENASELALATDDGDVVLGYYDAQDHMVRREIVTQNDRSTDATYDIDNTRSLRELGVASGGTVWTVASQTMMTGFYADGNTVEELSFITEDLRVQGLALQETSVGPVLRYSRIAEDDVRPRSLAYRLHAGGEWRPEQVPAKADRSSDIVIRQSAIAQKTDTEGLLTLVGAKQHKRDAVHDLFAVEQPLRPSYAITAEGGQQIVEPGESLTVSYTITNTGDLNGDAIGSDPVLVEARSQGDTLAEQQEAPLDRGETASGDLTVTVDSTGTVDIVVGRTLDLLDPEERRTTIEGSTPLLGIGSTSVDRPDAGTAKATIEFRNRGAIDAETFDMSVYAGDGDLLGEATVSGPAAGESSSATIQYDPSAIALGRGEQVHIDPGKDLPDSHVIQRVISVFLDRPAISVSDEITYRDSSSAPVAELTVTNDGGVPTQLTVRAVWADATPEDGSFEETDVLGTTKAQVPAAIDETPGSKNIGVTLDGAEYGDELRFVLESERPVTEAGIPIVYDRVGPYEPTVLDYTNADGIVDVDGLRDAIADWRGDDIDTDLLRDVIGAWRSGDPVT